MVTIKEKSKYINGMMHVLKVYRDGSIKFSSKIKLKILLTPANTHEIGILSFK